MPAARVAVAADGGRAASTEYCNFASLTPIFIPIFVFDPDFRIASLTPICAVKSWGGIPHADEVGPAFVQF